MKTNNSNPKPLSDLNVLDLSNFLAGPILVMAAVNERSDTKTCRAIQSATAIGSCAGENSTFAPINSIFPAWGQPTFSLPLKLGRLGEDLHLGFSCEFEKISECV
jgi:hypothetical protein